MLCSSSPPKDLLPTLFELVYEQIPLFFSKSFNSIRVRSTEVRPNEFRPTEVSPTKFCSTKFRSTEVRFTNVHPTEVRSKNSQPIEIHFGVGSELVELTNLSITEKINK